MSMQFPLPASPRVASSPRKKTFNSNNLVATASLFTTLHSPSRETELGDAARTAVSVTRKNGAELPPYLTTAFKQLHMNLDGLDSMFRRVGTFTQTEAFMAASKGTVMFQSQREVLEDLKRCCEAEFEFLNGKLQDSDRKNNGMFTSPEEKSTSFGWQSVYASLAAAARVCNAQSGAVFVVDDKKNGQVGSGLQLACFVSAAKLTPLDSGTLHADILDIAESVARTRCSLNARAAQVARKARSGFESILACPIYIPGSGVLCGVIAVMNRNAPTRSAARMFSQDDEGRLCHAAESVAELIGAFHLDNEATFISPTNFENIWNVATHETTVLEHTAREAVPRGYVYRDEGVLPTTTAKQYELQTSRQRSLVDRSSPLVDILQRCNELESQIQKQTSELSSKTDEICGLHAKIDAQKLQIDAAVKHAESMRLANELLLRNAFVSPQNQHQSPIAEPRGEIDFLVDVEEATTSCLVAVQRATPQRQKKYALGPVTTVGPQSMRRSRRI